MVWHEIFISLDSNSFDQLKQDIFVQEWNRIYHCGFIWNIYYDRVHWFAIWSLSACLLCVMFVGSGVLLECWMRLISCTLCYWVTYWDVPLHFWCYTCWAGIESPF